MRRVYVAQAVLLCRVLCMGKIGATASQSSGVNLGAQEVADVKR